MRFRVILPAVLMLMLLVPSAQAGSIDLSELSSEPLTNPASTLDATVVFAITAADEVTISLINLTSAPAEYDINNFLFNVTSNVTGLTLLSVTQSVAGNGGWDLQPSTGAGGPTHNGGFGIFDFRLKGPNQGNSPKVITPGETIDFVLQIAGTGPFIQANFVTDLSVQTPNGGNILSLVAAKFIEGPTQPEDSAWGATIIPEPGTLALALVSGIALISRRRRR